MTNQLQTGVNSPNNSGVQPKNYLVESILVTIFCCLPLGIVGIVFASQVSSKYTAGDYAGAVESSKQAKKFMIWGPFSWYHCISCLYSNYGNNFSWYFVSRIRI